jgi:hypothetical protein
MPSAELMSLSLARPQATAITAIPIVITSNSARVRILVPTP